MECGFILGGEGEDVFFVFLGGIIVYLYLSSFIKDDWFIMVNYFKDFSVKRIF